MSRDATERWVEAGVKARAGHKLQREQGETTKTWVWVQHADRGVGGSLSEGAFAQLHDSIH